MCCGKEIFATFCLLFIGVCFLTATDRVREDFAFIVRSRSLRAVPSKVLPASFSSSTSEAAWLVNGLFRVYQNLISTQDRSVCNFTISCSQFALNAVRDYGIFHGLLMASDRIQRCNGLSRNYYAIDPKTGLAIDNAMESYYLGKKGRD